MWKNIGLSQIKHATVDSFTSDFGIRFRRIINPLWRQILRLAIKQRVHIDYRYPLEKGMPYIFSATHSFIEDVITNMAYIDRSTYMLVGTTDQIDHNPQMYAAWLNGIIYVNRLENESRKSSIEKMKRIIYSGSSVVLFPEGGWNNSENLLCLPLFSGPWKLACDTKRPVVPIAVYHEYDSKNIFISFGAPIDLARRDKDSGLAELRDAMATLRFDLIRKYSTPIAHDKLEPEYREKYMEERKNEYLRTKWSHDVWDEEITIYRNKRFPPTPCEICESMTSVKLTASNISLILPFLKRREEFRKFDFLEYMQNHWND